MVITICEQYQGQKVRLHSNSKKFQEFVEKEYSKGFPTLDPKDGIYCYKGLLFYWMLKVADYANNTLKEECIFDVE